MRYLFLETRAKQLKQRREENQREMRQLLYKAFSSTVKTPKGLKPQSLDPVLFNIDIAKLDKVPIYENCEVKEFKKVECHYVFHRGTSGTAKLLHDVIEYLIDYHKNLKPGESVYASDIMQGIQGYDIYFSTNFIAEPDEILIFGSAKFND